MARRTTIKVLVKLVLAIAVICGGVLVFGRSEAVDETTPIAEVKAEAERLDPGALRKMASRYKDAFMDKQRDLKRLKAELKDISLAGVTGEVVVILTKDIEELTRSAAAIKERFEVYRGELKSKGYDVSRLNL